MAKGRKLGFSMRQDRLLGTFGHGGGHGGATDISELEEEDVWSMVDDMENMDLADHHQSPTRVRNGWSSARNRRRSGGGGREERRLGVQGGLSMAFVDDTAGNGKPQGSRIVHQFRGGQESVQRGSTEHHHMATSAPVNVPDWPKILRVDSVESMHDSDDHGFEDGESEERIPPHEYLAREYARTRKMTATSVLEGVGRTLKGRDMSRVRDAVWSQTGFYG